MAIACTDVSLVYRLTTAFLNNRRNAAENDMNNMHIEMPVKPATLAAAEFPASQRPLPLPSFRRQAHDRYVPLSPS